MAGGLTIGGPGNTIRLRLRAWPRIGVLVNQLRSVFYHILPSHLTLWCRQLLDAQLAAAFENASLVNLGQNNPVLDAMLALLTKEGI